MCCSMLQTYNVHVRVCETDCKLHNVYIHFLCLCFISTCIFCVCVLFSPNFIPSTLENTAYCLCPIIMIWSKQKTKTKTQISSFWLTYLFYFAAPRTFPRKMSGVWSSVRWYSMFWVVCLLKRPGLHPQPHHRGRSAPRERTSPITETGTKRSLALHHSGPPK
jgi:quinol-cytochrome oxidoreductase complex cytochrome b subunit